jgi:molybdopterin-guanine dinucleotide biosynthesis protein A
VRELVALAAGGLVVRRQRNRSYHLKLQDDRRETITGFVHCVCRACGDEFSFCTPCSIPMLSGSMRAFQREHRECLPEWEEQRAALVEALVQRAFALAMTEQETR